MARFLIKHDAVPPSWARINAKGDKVEFGSREKATEFGDADEALAAFEKAAAAMAEAAQAKEQAIKKSGKLPQLRYGEELIEKIAPTWLRKKMGWKTDYWLSATGLFVAEATKLDDQAGGAFDLFYARSELGWLGTPRLKARFGGADWRDDMALAQAFVSEQALEAALALSPQATRVSRFKVSAVFTQAKLHPQADDIYQGIAAGVESRAIQANLEPSLDPEKSSNRKTGARL